MNSFGMLNRRIGAKFFRTTELLKSNRSSKKVKILFSNKQDWEWMIRQGFEHTNHEIEFIARISLKNWKNP